MRIARILLLASVSTLPAFASVAPDHNYRIIGYVRGIADLNAIDAARLTHLNYSFAKLNPLGVINFENPSAPAHIAQLQALKARNPDLKVIVSVGGWGADFFSTAASDEASRCRFTDSAIAMIKEYALDGIDIDWEYPAQPTEVTTARPEDKHNFTLMLQELRYALDALSDVRGRKGPDRYTISIATSAGPRYFGNVEMSELQKYVDWMNVMTYDFAGEWSPVTGHHTDVATTEQFVRQHLAAGVPASKIVVGVAFFGKSWRGVLHRDTTGLSQPFDQPDLVEEPYSMISAAYMNAPGYERHWDEAARAPYLWSRDAGRFVTYDDPQSIAEKARLVKNLHLGGLMYWEQSEEPTGVLLDAIVAGLR